MARTFTCNEEIIVVSKGTEDVGKLAMLGNSGKFDPSVIPEIATKKVVRTIVSREQPQSIPYGVGTSISFDNIINDNASGFSIEDPTKIFIKEDGVYSLCANVRWAVGTTLDQLGITIYVNDNPIAYDIIANYKGTGATMCGSCSICYPLKTNDNIRLEVWQYASPTTLNTYPKQVNLSVVKMGDL